MAGPLKKTFFAASLLYLVVAAGGGGERDVLGRRHGPLEAVVQARANIGTDCPKGLNIFLE